MKYNEIADLKKENEYLRDQFYGQRVIRRQAIIQDLIRQGYDLDTTVSAADRLCTFIEGWMPSAKPTKVVKMGAAAAPKKRRKYTKRSKLWKKKGA